MKNEKSLAAAQPDKANVWLSARALAILVGQSRGEEPISDATVRRWMRVGVLGVVLYSEWDVSSRRTTWQHYLEFRAAVAKRAELRREQRNAAAKRAASWTKEMRKAKEYLERHGLG